jgi:hypothetical protein
MVALGMVALAQPVRVPSTSYVTVQSVPPKGDPRLIWPVPATVMGFRPKLKVPVVVVTQP